MVEYRNFFVRFSGDGGRMTLNEKDDCWEYLCPGKGKIVAWLDPNDEEECVFLNVRFLDVNGAQLPKNESKASISYAIAFVYAGMAALEFRPTRNSLMMALPYGHGHWTKIVRPDQIVGLPALILFAKNSFDVDYLLIPERPEFFPREEREMTPEREEIIKKMEAFKARMQEREKEMEKEARENIQRANEDWKEWERRQSEENDSNRSE
ncbi:MAG: hypothetical protein IJF84_14975 [Thermoguttaceae bacterium]|nr:hypothetical protein [Thermoguttaceae bacterium]